MLTSDLIAAFEAVQNRFERFLMIARRWNVELADDWDFMSPSWEAKLRAYVREHGTIEPSYGGVDLFVYRRGLWKHLQPFAIGRTRWDSGLIYEARKLRAPVIETTRVVTAVHPNHGYSHDPQDTSGVFKGPEALRNQSLLGGTSSFLPPSTRHMFSPSLAFVRIGFVSSLFAATACDPAGPSSKASPARPVVRFLAPWWRRLRPRKKKRRSRSLRATPQCANKRRPVRKTNDDLSKFLPNLGCHFCLAQ